MKLHCWALHKEWQTRCRSVYFYLSLCVSRRIMSHTQKQRQDKRVKESEKRKEKRKDKMVENVLSLPSFAQNNTQNCSNCSKRERDFPPELITSSFPFWKGKKRCFQSFFFVLRTFSPFLSFRENSSTVMSVLTLGWCLYTSVLGVYPSICFVSSFSLFVLYFREEHYFFPLYKLSQGCQIVCTNRGGRQFFNTEESVCNVLSKRGDEFWLILSGKCGRKNRNSSFPSAAWKWKSDKQSVVRRIESKWSSNEREISSSLSSS